MAKNDYIYCNEEKKVIGTYVHYVRPPHLEFEPLPGVEVNDAIKAAIDLATTLRTKVKMSINDVTLSVPPSDGITVQKIKEEYLKSLGSR